MSDRPGTDMSHEHEWRHGAEWKQQARDPDYRPITEESDMTSADGHGVYLTHEEYTALLSERDALEAENQKLRGVLEAAATALDWAKHHLKKAGIESAQVSETIPEVRAALAEQEKTDG